jgi:hypothetical protein
MSRTARVSKTNIIAAAVALLIAVPGGTYLLTRPDAQPKQATSATSHEVLSEHKEHSDVTIASDHVTYKGEEGKTALELLKKHATVQTEPFGSDELVTTINGTEGKGSKYWSFYVNGAMASVGAGSYVTHSGDTIEWKLEKL